MSKVSRTKLAESIQFYRKNREKIIKIHLTTNEAFKEIMQILDKSINDLLGIVNLENLSNISQDLGGLNCQLNNLSGEKSDQENSADPRLSISIVANSNMITLGQIENPAIAVIGQVKAGKSTFVNSLLKKNVVCQAFEKCTARIIRLQYSEKNYVEIVDQNGIVLKHKALKTPEIPKKYIKLPDNHRNNPDETNKQIVAGINSEFLKCGIDLIDSPGLSENETLDNMSKAIAKNVLPIVIYVIDGCTSVKQTDISYLIELKAKSRNIQIIYFITKLDSADDESNKSEQERIEKAEEMMDIAFRKLQFNNLIPSDKFKNWHDCPYFHGASLYKYSDYLKDFRNEECNYHYERFSEFELALDKFLVDQFCIKIDEPCETLINFHLDVLTKIIQRAQIFADFTKDNLAQIKQMKVIENVLYEKLKTVISESKEELKNRLVERLHNQSESIVEPIGNLVYPESLRIPEDGRVSNTEIIQSCHLTILKMVCQSLESIILQFVQEELFEKYKQTIEAEITKRMTDYINDQDTTKASSKSNFKSPYRITLDRLLARKYKFSAIKGNLNNADGRNFIMKLMESILNSIARVFRRLFLVNQSQERVDVKSANWKKQKAVEVLKKLNHQHLAEEVCNDLQNDFDERHQNFLKALEKEFNFVQKDIVLSEVTRQLLAGKAPEFTILLMLTLDVKSSYMLKDAKDIQKIGSGAQGDVYSCQVGDRMMARKTADIQLQQFCIIAEEIYYSYLMKHQHMLMLEGIKLEESDKPDQKQISVFYPLMKTDVLDYIKTNKTEFSERMNFGLQVAEALQYLHSLKIMHRDLKLANILLDENNNVYLADYGLCKSVALTGHSFVGTPVHIAPEIVKKELYDFKVDVFSFGILLWYLAEGTGRHPIYVHILGEASKVIIGGSEYNMRPERLAHISDDLWSIMEDCWHSDKSKRPDIDEVVERLKSFVY